MCVCVVIAVVVIKIKWSDQRRRKKTQSSLCRLGGINIKILKQNY